MSFPEKNETPDDYLYFPYEYTRFEGLTILRKNFEIKILVDEEEAEFFAKCNFAIQQGRSHTEVIKEYFNPRPAPEPQQLVLF
jgi:hypothetical protein